MWPWLVLLEIGLGKYGWRLDLVISLERAVAMVLAKRAEQDPTFLYDDDHAPCAPCDTMMRKDCYRSIIRLLLLLLIILLFGYVITRRFGVEGGKQS